MFNLKTSSLTVLAAFACFASFAQSSNGEDMRNWHLKDRTKDGYYGISLDKAYEFVKGRKSQTVIVAVIDSGIDTTHEDLKPVLWRNAKEVPGNGIDDDRNGYVDDIHGWNFLGGKDGRNVTSDSYEAARVYHKWKLKFEKLKDDSSLSKDEKEQYAMWKRAEKQVVGDSKESGMQLLILKKTYDAAAKSDSIIRKGLGKDVYTGAELDAFTPADEPGKKAKQVFLYFFKANNSMEMKNSEFLNDFRDYLSGEEKKAEAAEKAPHAYRAEIVQDNYNDINDRYYGNNNIMVDENAAKHGTHVSGIIGALRSNNKGSDGIADNVRIMTVRAVPDGDEHDKDVALAIRYAVDNGAKVINMSFGKYFSPEKSWVDDAVEYALSKNVLLVDAAGNEGYQLDSIAHFPNSIIKKTNQRAPNWITVGASSDPKIGGLVANFSNYGKQEVDVFAPGVNIYATVPGGNTYASLSGTSMASPVVAGTAAFLRSYYPNLTAIQIKQIIESSAVKIKDEVELPGDEKKVAFSDLSKTGGLLNAYEAVKLADAMSRSTNRKTGAEVKVKKDGGKTKVKTEPKKTEKKETYKSF